ncbi:MAG: helicase-related protein [Bacillota bacterium]|jgi:superfamily II DNA or RNA helicase/HKD family nuclease
MANNFITNAQQHTLKERIHTLIKHSQELKFLVGFFYFSGWSELYDVLKTRDDLRLKILIGLDTDLLLDKVIEVADPMADTRTQQELLGRFYASLRTAMQDEALDTQEFYEQVNFFLDLLEEGRLQIRKTFDPNHAKLYLFCLDKTGQSLVNSPGRFITGSSNLTRNGLLGQCEFNVEIGDYGWEDAEAYFDNLWDTAIVISELNELRDQIIRIIRRQTQVAEVTPFEAYTMVLKTYLDLMEQKMLRPHVKRLMEERSYRIYRYQEDAVQQALTVLEGYGGVILADVVGLGKSIIASWVAREHNGRGLVICPPALIGDRQTKSTGWYKYLNDFGLYDWDVYSLGELDKVQEFLSLYGGDISTIIVDEAHRFRNEDTEAYERLSQICANRSVILLTATPFNNTPTDIFALLKLFIPPGKSTLTLDEKLTARFARYNSEFRKLSFIIRYHNVGGEKQAKAEKYYNEIFELSSPIDISRTKRRVKQLAGEIRAVIEPIIIRRNRLDLKNDPVYAQELTALSDVADPIELFYELTPEQSNFYDRVINEYFGENGRFRGAIYQPYAYENRNELAQLDEEGNFAFLQQRNLYEFMRRLLVKRFESSFGAFANSVHNFIQIHSIVLAFIEKTGRYILDRRLIEKIWEEDEETIEVMLQQFAERLAEEENLNPRHDRVYVIEEFDEPEQFLDDIRSDIELLKYIAEQVSKLELVTKDPKSERLVEAVREIIETQTAVGEPCRKVVIFSEYMDTVKHIVPILKNAFPDRVLVAEGSLSKRFFDALLANFDASYPIKKQRDQFDIIVTTDKLSEGVNLNRAGAVINYDIPWNPTRVIQRLGRINRIGHKVFQTLYIYNFFPTEQGAEVVKSREIAAQKMFLIHNTLGEDAKIFAPEETPSPAELFKRINRNPEEEEEESLLTTIRKEFYTIKEKYPDVVRGLADFPVRVKTAKLADHNNLLVFRKKGLQLFIQTVPDTANEKIEVNSLMIEETLPYIRCQLDTPRQPLTSRFWPSYEKIKTYREQTLMPRSEQSLIVKAENNLRSALANYAAELEEYIPFIQTLLRDLKEYQTLPKYTLRRLTVIEMNEKVTNKGIERFRDELELLRRYLGEDYLERIEKRIKDFHSQIIIAIENINAEV